MDLTTRASLHAAVGEPTRLRIVEELVVSDRSPGELSRRLGVRSNLLSHHLDVLEDVGLVHRTPSEGDGRRRYLKVAPDMAHRLGVVPTCPDRALLFVCTHNSARSQLAAALWRAASGREGQSAGTHPADRVHAGAVAAAHRLGIDLTAAVPRHVDSVAAQDWQVVTVCDRANEELDAPGDRWHWSIPDPVLDGSATAFGRAATAISERVHDLARRPSTWN